MSSQSPALPTLRLEILLVSFSAIVLEIALTRIFSYKLYDYFTYLILGTAMLGLGSGGVLVALVPALRRAGAERVVALGALAAGLAIPGTLAAVAFVQLNTVDLASHPTEALKLAALCLALFAPFLGVGVCVAKILGARAAQVHALYFAALGLGFMFFEVSLIQKLTLFLGYPTYSLGVTLFSLLVASGLGSLASGRFVRRRNRAFALLLPSLALLAVVYETALPSLFAALGDAALPARAALAVVLLAPLGLCLGAFLPLGLRSVAALGERGEEYVAWAWGVNGFFSVVSSVLATILSMTLGFQAVLALAVGVYALGIAAFWRVPEPSGWAPAADSYSR